MKYYRLDTIIDSMYYLLDMFARKNSFIRLYPYTRYIYDQSCLLFRFYFKQKRIRSLM